MREHAAECLEVLPLYGRIGGVRQCRHDCQSFAKRLFLSQRGKHAQECLLVIAVLGRETLSPVYATPPRSRLGQQQSRDAAPPGELARGIRRHVLKTGPRGSLSDFVFSVARRVVQERLEARFKSGGTAPFDTREFLQDGLFERKLEHAPQIQIAAACDVAQPLVAPGQQIDQQGLEARLGVVQYRQQGLKRLAKRSVCPELVERSLSCQSVKRTGVLGDACARRTARQNRQLLRQPCVERVERVDPHAPGRRKQRPAASAVAFQRGACKLVGQRAMRFRRGISGSGFAQRPDDARAHFRGGLSGERDRDDLLGLFDRGKQGQVALNEKFRLARSRRRLHDERTTGVERAAPCQVVGRSQAHVRCCHVATSS